MSSDLGLLSFKDGKPAKGIPSEILLKALGPYIQKNVDQYGERWELVFPDGSGGNMMPIIEGRPQDLCINRPHGVQLFDALYEIMRQTHTLMYWTGVENLITADESIAEHLEPDYIYRFGVPPLVRSGADILAEIAKT